MLENISLEKYIPNFVKNSRNIKTAISYKTEPIPKNELTEINLRNEKIY